jgi:hypothetical protein
MNKQVILGALGGFLIGIPVGYFLKKFVDDRRFERELEDEEYDIFDDDPTESERELEQKLMDDSVIEISEINRQVKMNETLRYESKTDYKDDIRDVDSDNEVEDLDDEPVVDENYEAFAARYEHPTDDGENLKKEPYVITYEQFDDEHLEYKKTTLTYLNGDQTLIDENEEVLSVNDVIGLKTIAYFKTITDDYGSNAIEKTPVIYVRNDSIGEDFEVIWSELSYGRDYLGLFDE